MITLFSVILAIIGALNWFLVGVAQLDLVALIFGGAGAVVARIIYILVGIAGIWLAISLIRGRGEVASDV